MKYIKKINEMSDEITKDEIIQELKDCFINIEDLIGKSTYGATRMFTYGLSFKIHTRDFHFGRRNFGYNISCDFEVTIVPKFKDDPSTFLYMKKRDTIFNDNIINEIEDAVYSSSGILNLKLLMSVVEYRTKYGIPYAFFNETGENTPDMDKEQKNSYGEQESINKKGPYDINYLYDFLRSLKEDTRSVRLYFKKIK